MKIVIIGSPGSGKTWLAKKLEVELHLQHIEGDELFWDKDKELQLENFRLAVREQLAKSRWIYEGHTGKVFDILSLSSPFLIVIQEKTAVAFFRSLKKDFIESIKGPYPRKNFSRMIHHLRHWTKMRKKRDEIIDKYNSNNPDKIIYWDGMSTTIENLLVSLKKSDH